jgi:hypothetical protein
LGIHLTELTPESCLMHKLGHILCLEPAAAQHCASACTAHSSVHYSRFIITKSCPCVLMFVISFLSCSPFFSPPAPSLSQLSLSNLFPRPY